MVAAVLDADLTEERLERPRNGAEEAEEVQGEAERLWRVESQQAARAGRHSEQRRTARLGSARRELGEGGERLELATDVEESGEASRRDARRDGRRVAMDVEKRRRLRRGVPSRERDGVRAIS